MDSVCLHLPRSSPLEEGGHQSSQLAHGGVHGTCTEIHFHPNTLALLVPGSLTREVQYLDIWEPQSNFK